MRLRVRGFHGLRWIPCRFHGVVLALILTAPALAGALSLEAERKLGRQFDLAARARLPVVTNPDITGYVRRVGKRVAAALDDPVFKYRFTVVRDASINAFAVPGGYVYVNSGLVASVRREDELATVLGHEIAHVHAHHLARREEATRLTSYAALLGAVLSIVQPAIGALAGAAHTANQLSYSRKFEQEADYMGVRFARRAGYDPRAMLSFLNVLRRVGRLNPAGVPPYLLSHPVTDERFTRLESVLSAYGKATPAVVTGGDFALVRVQAETRAGSSPSREVLAEYRRRVEAHPEDLQARYLFGLVCLETGQVDSARSALLAARSGGFAAATRELGRLALRTGDLANARTLLDEARRGDPADAMTTLALARTLEALGETEAALQRYREAVALAPRLAPAHHGLGMLAGRSGEQVTGYYHLATALRLRGDYRHALSYYTRADKSLSENDPRREDVRRQIRVLSDFLNVKRPPAHQEKKGKASRQ